MTTTPTPSPTPNIPPSDSSAVSTNGIERSVSAPLGGAQFRGGLTASHLSVRGGEREKMMAEMDAARNAWFSTKNGRGWKEMEESLLLVICMVIIYGQLNLVWLFVLWSTCSCMVICIYGMLLCVYMIYIDS